MSKAFDILFAASVLMLAGCSHITADGGTFVEGYETVPVAISFFADTKAAVGEKDINTVDIFAVNEDIEEIDSYLHIEGVNAKMNIRKNANIRIMALVNVPQKDVVSVKEVADLYNLYLRLDDIPELGFAMTGECRGYYTEETSISLEVMRLASKIKIETLTAAFMDDEDAPSKVTLDSVFVINVCRSEPSSMIPFADPDSTGWINRLTQDKNLSEGLKSMLAHNEGRAILSSATIDCKHTFYVYPNPVDNTIDSFDFPMWSRRNTRLVLRFTIDGEVHYFPISMPAMKSNRQYLVKHLIITIGKGSRLPDIPVSNSRLTFKLDVHGWDYKSMDLDFE